MKCWRNEVVNMLMSEYDYELDIEVQREEAFEEGQKAGEKRGEKIGEENAQKRFTVLAAKLVEVGRSDDVIKAAQDVELCEKLYREYDIEAVHCGNNN